MPNNVVSNSISILKARQGGSVFVVDLDNEMTNIVVNENGNTKSAVTLQPLVRAYYGTESVIGNCTVTVSSSSVSIVAAYNQTTHCVDISISSGVQIPDLNTVVVTVVHPTYGTRTVDFTISTTREGTDASIQELLPSLNEISFARQADKTLTPASRNLTLSFKKTKGNTTTIQSISEAGLTIRWSVVSMPSATTNGSNWGQNPSTPPTGITWSNITMTVANTVTASNIYIACFNSGGTLVDRETIPIIKDGQHGNDGDDAPAAFATPEQITVQCNSNGNVPTATTVGVNFSMKVGTHDATVTTFSAQSALPTGVTVQSQYTNVCTITIGTTATASGMASGVTFTVTGSYSGKTYTAKVTVALIGALSGGRGKVGRFFYYAGEFDSSDNTKTFVVNDAQAPYFSHSGNYHVYNPSSNGTFTMAQMWSNSSQSWNNEPWDVMTNDFKYLITEAIFGQYAHFGASIINGDYLLSQYGYMRGFGEQKTQIDDSTQYVYADPDDMFGEDEWDLTDKNTIVGQSLNLDVRDSTRYAKINSVDSFALTKDRWYTIWLSGYCEGGSNTYKLSVALGTSTSNLVPNSEISIKGYNFDRSDGIFDSYITFRATANYPTCYMYVKNNDLDAIGYVKSIVLRYAQFVPNLCIDMKSGKLEANNIKARGKLYADSFVYVMQYGNSNSDLINVNDESIINLGSTAVGTVVNLPSPTSSKGRRIEIFNNASQWQITWVGATVGSSLQAAYGSGLDYRTSYNLQLDYMLVYSDGTNWWCLKAE